MKIEYSGQRKQGADPFKKINCPKMDRALVRVSKFLSLVLRHQPQRIGLSLDGQGWADVAELIEKSRGRGPDLTIELIKRVVTENDKQRFTLNKDGTRIRANQGHSIGIDLGLDPVEPPELLYHGTARKNSKSILERGLERRRRDYVHLSPDHQTAVKVGQRHGRPIVLTVRSGAMHRSGYKFYLSKNGVWLTEAVPADFIIGEKA